MSMMKRTSALLGFMLLFGVASAWAQTAVFDLTTTPTNVAKTGMSEVLGQVALTAPAICGTNADGKCTTTAGTISILYIGVAIDNGIATGIQVCETINGVGPTCNAAGTYVTGTVTVSNTPQGGSVTFGVKGSVDLAAGDQVTINGARGRIALSSANTPFGSPGQDIVGQLTASPSTIASSSPVQQVVARSADAMTIEADSASILQCIGVGEPDVTVSELFTTAFVDNGNDPTDPELSPPANARPKFGATNNTRVNIVVTGLPSGVTLTWPVSSDTDVNTGAQLLLISQSASGDQVSYVFDTPDQGLSDTFLENFLIEGIGVGLSNTPADFGNATVQAQLFPPASPSTARPRYADPLHPTPGLPFLTVGPCATNILFPFVANVLGFDTGIALVNTSVDPFAPLVGPLDVTPAQSGTCTVTGFPKGEGTPIAWTTPNISAGDTFPFVLSSGVFAGFEGYLIVRCNFQYGHGFAFITNNFGTGNPPTVGQGYVALIIPDPAILGFRFAGNFTNPEFGTLEEGEALDN